MRWTQKEREGQRMHSSDSQCPLLLASCMMHVFPTIDHQNTCAKHLIKDRSPSFFLHFCTCTMIYILIYSHNKKNKKADVQTYKHQHIKHQISKTCRQGLKAPPLKRRQLPLMHSSHAVLTSNWAQLNFIYLFLFIFLGGITLKA